MTDLILQEKELQCPLCKNGFNISHMEDPLAHEMFPLEQKALLLMVKILDNLEEFKELSGNLQTLMEEGEMLETNLLSLFKVLINGIELEYKQLGYLP